MSTTLKGSEDRLIYTFVITLSGSYTLIEGGSRILESNKRKIKKTRGKKELQ